MHDSFAPRSYNVFLVAGQSNADGRVVWSNGPSYLLGSNIPGVYGFDGSEPTPYDIYNVGPTGCGQGWTDPRPQRYGFATLAAYGLQATVRNVMLCQVSNGDTILDARTWPNGSWSADYDSIPSGTVKLLQQLELRYAALVAWAATNSVTLNVRGLIWHQGEADHNGGASATYAASFAALITKVRTFTALPTLPIFYGTIASASASYNTTIKAAQLDFAAGDAHAWCRDNTSLTLFDTAHFDAASSQTFADWVISTYNSNYGS
jgi:hypothetical protein